MRESYEDSHSEMPGTARTLNRRLDRPREDRPQAALNIRHFPRGPNRKVIRLVRKFILTFLNIY